MPTPSGVNYLLQFLQFLLIPQLSETRIKSGRSVLCLIFYYLSIGVSVFVKLDCKDTKNFRESYIFASPFIYFRKNRGSYPWAASYVTASVSTSTRTRRDFQYKVDGGIDFSKSYSLTQISLLVS